MPATRYHELSTPFAMKRGGELRGARIAVARGYVSGNDRVQAVFERAVAQMKALGAVVVADPEEPPLPFADGAFDLVTSRHPATVHWNEIARVLAKDTAELKKKFVFQDWKKINEQRSAWIERFNREIKL